MRRETDKTVYAGIMRLWTGGQRILHNEAAGGIFLLIAAVAALFFVNSPWSESYASFVHLPMQAGIGAWQWNFDTHFLVSDILMTFFFLAAGVEIRQELHNGALAQARQAVLPLVAAVGGVCLPALIYLLFTFGTDFTHGWAVPTATDIAFAVGILALLGSAIPANVRVILLSLAIIDDIIAVLIITVFYSGGISADGTVLTAAAALFVFLLRYFAYFPVVMYGIGGVLLWLGLWRMGIHPSLAGVVLGLLIPVVPFYDKRAMRQRRHKLAAMRNGNIREISSSAMKKDGKISAGAAAEGERKLLQAVLKNGEAPTKQVQKALHIWVAYIIMPLFAFVNAGVRMTDTDFTNTHSLPIFLGVFCGLVVGKPLGVLCASYAAVKIGLCRLPPHLNWRGMVLVGLLAGIGFTMALFVSMLGFNDKGALSLAILAVLCGSGLSALLGLGYGLMYRLKYAES